LLAVFIRHFPTRHDGSGIFLCLDLTGPYVHNDQAPTAHSERRLGQRPDVTIKYLRRATSGAADIDREH
jgi:hypothetical protein